LNWIVEEVPELKGYQVEWAEEGNYYLSRRNQLFYSSTLVPPFTPVAVIGAPSWRQAVSRFRFAQRLLRFMVTNVIPLNKNEIFVTFDKTVGVIRDGKYSGLKGLTRPCRVLRSACAVDAKGNVFFGEYLLNPDRGEMLVYKFSPGDDEVKTIYTFPAESIRHIHGLYYDPYTDSIFCLTGDVEKECQILQTFDEFHTLHVIGRGDETWRAVSILFAEDVLFYGMDAEMRANHIYRFNRQSFERTSIGEVDGPVYYSKQIGTDDMFFTTTAENAPSQTENVAAIWNASADGKCEEIVKFKKDLWHPTLFMFGTIHFPYGNDIADELYFHLVGVMGDNRTYRIRRA
jgi:hypothetical protein